MNSNAHHLSTDVTDSTSTTPGFANIAEANTLAALPYLAASAFKTPTTLTRALNQLARQLHSAKANTYHHEENSFQISLADNIVSTLVAANRDYASKLELLAAAAKHPIFKPKASFWRWATNLAKLVPLIRNLISDQPSEAAIILAVAKTRLMKSRNKMILS